MAVAHGSPFLPSAMVIISSQSDCHLAGDRHRYGYGQSRRRDGVADTGAFRRMGAYSIAKQHFDRALSSRRPCRGSQNLEVEETNLGPVNPIPDDPAPQSGGAGAQVP